VVAIASRDASRAAAAAVALGIPRAHGSYEALLADADVEAVYVPLPNHLHAEWTMRAAAAGKHVLCEKPLAMSAAEAGEMIAACERAGVMLMEAFMYRLHPMWQRARELVDSGAVGELLAIQAFFSYRNVDPTNIRNIASYGGGAVMDIGCYPINVARWMFDGEPDEIVASVRRDAAFGTDVLTSAILAFGGRQASFTCSTQIEDDQRVHLVGTAGRLVIEIPFNIPPDRPTRIVRAAGGDPPVAPGIEVIEVPAADPYGVQADAFSTALRISAPVPLPPADAVGNLRVIEHILASR
jgi:predicted dehydrogenase